MSLLLRLVGKLPRSWITAVSRSQWRHPVFQRAFRFCAGRLQGQDGVIQQGIGKGLRFNTGPANAGYLLGTAEPEVQTALATFLHRGMVAYDIGANVGFYTLIAARLVGAEGRVVAFEPLAANLLSLRHNLSLNAMDSVLVREEAVGNEDGTARFVVSGEVTLGHLASLGKSLETGATVHTVAVRRLDSLLREGSLPAPGFLKIDVEGAEADVLAGGQALLESVRPVLLIELHGTNEPIADALDRLRYHVVALGQSEPPRQARWNSHLVAVPCEQAGLVSRLDGLARSALGLR